MNKPDWLDLFVLFVPFSLLGAIFGDSIRKDALTRPQRISAGLFSLVVGPVAGLVVMREFGWLDGSTFNADDPYDDEDVERKVFGGHLTSGRFAPDPGKRRSATTQ